MHARPVTLALAVLMTAAMACEKDPQPPETPTAGSSAGEYDPCADKACGDSCTICAPDDADCVETMSVKQCDAESVCTDQAVTCE